METIVSDAEHLLDAPAVCATTTAVRQVLDTLPECRDDIRAMFALAWVGEHLANPVFSHTDAIGSVMRKKIEPVTQPIQQQLACLRGKVR